MIRTPQEKKIEKTITPIAESMGFEVVRVLVTGSGKPTLQVMAERNDGSGMITLDECGKLSQAISAVLDVEGVMGNDPYYLEVGSPGIDRPLTRLKDFERYQGRQVRLEVEPAVNGRKRFRGELLDIAGEMIRMNAEDGEVDIPFASVQKAKLSIEEDEIQPKQKKKKF